MKINEFIEMPQQERERRARENPEEFEADCREAIQDLISTYSGERKKRLQQIQWKIDGSLRRFKDPVARMNAMCELFWTGFELFQSSLNDYCTGKTTTN